LSPEASRARARARARSREEQLPAHIFLFSLEELRDRFGAATPAGADARHDTAAFRAFRAALLAACAAAARAPLSLSMWWEGTYNGYALAIAAEPTEALGPVDLSAVCPADAERTGTPRAERRPLGRAWPGGAEAEQDAEGASWEAPFGAAAGHFGAPGMRRIR
jgi:hypothetical protein